MSTGTAVIKKITPFYSLRIPWFDTKGWGRELERNFDIIDAALFATGQITGIRGIWNHDVSYAEGDRVVDDVTGVIYVAEVAHTSPSTGTFAEFRASNPSYWKLTKPLIESVGEWDDVQTYNLNNIITDGPRVGIVCVNQYVSDTSYDNDVSNGKIITLIDLSPQLSQANVYVGDALGHANDALSYANIALGHSNDASNFADTSEDWSDVSKGWAETAQSQIQGTGVINYLINTDFIVNQRGYVNDNQLTPGEFGHDRWMCYSGVETEYSVSGGVVTLKGANPLVNGFLAQIIETPDWADKNVTISVDTPTEDILVKLTDHANPLLSVSGTITAGSGRRSVTLSVPSGYTSHIILEFQPSALPCSFSKPQAVIGNLPVIYQKLPEHMLFPACFRYYYKLTYNVFPMARVSTHTTRFYNGTHLTPMRAAPTITADTSGGSFVVREGSTTNYVISLELNSTTSVNTLSNITCDAEITP